MNLTFSTSIKSTEYRKATNSISFCQEGDVLCCSLWDTILMLSQSRTKGTKQPKNKKNMMVFLHSNGKSRIPHFTHNFGRNHV